MSQTRPRMIEIRLELGRAEIDAFAKQLGSQPLSVVQQLASLDPLWWAKRVAELYSVIALTRRLPQLALLGLPLQPASACTNARNGQDKDGTCMPMRSSDVPSPEVPAGTRVTTV